MKVSILYKNNFLETHENVRKISNQSTRIENDQLLIYFHNSPDPRPLVIPTRNILCVEVTS